MKSNRAFGCNQNALFSEQGGSLVELALVIPFLTVILFGIVEIGQVLSEMSWATHTACQTANFGSTANKTYGEGSMSALWDQLYQIQDDHLKEGVSSGFTATYLGDNEVKVSASPEVDGMFGKLQTKLGVNCTGSYLIKTVDSLNNFDGFANNNSGEYYNCSGTAGGSVNSTACNWSPPPPPPSSGGDSGCQCFSGDTPISMADGSQKPIASIQVGDAVLAFDEQSGKQTVGRVTKNFVRQAQSYFILNGTIKVTEEHPFYVAGRWVNTKNLKVGDQLTSLTGDSVRLESIEWHDGALEIFNMTVDSAHTYYAAGVLVHNKNCNGNDPVHGTGTKSG